MNLRKEDKISGKWSELVNTYPELGVFNNFVIEKDVELTLDEVYASLSDEIIILCNIFLEREESELTKQFLDIVKPELYITSSDCGIYLKGIEEMESKELREFFLRICNQPLTGKYYSTMISLNLNEKKNKFSFLLRGVYFEFVLFMKLSDEHKRKVCETIYKLGKILTYRKLDSMSNEEMKRERKNKYCVDIGKENLIKFITNITGLERVDIVKWMVLTDAHNHIWKVEPEQYLLYKQCITSLLFLDVKMTSNYIHHKPIEIEFNIDSLSGYLLKMYRRQMEDYLNEHIYDLFIESLKHISFTSEELCSIIMYLDKMKLVKKSGCSNVYFLEKVKE